MSRPENVQLSLRSICRPATAAISNCGGGEGIRPAACGTFNPADSQRLKRRSLNRPENASRLACYYALLLTLCGLVLTICVLQHSGSSPFREAVEWTQLIFFLAVLTGALMFLLWLMGHVMRLPPQSVPQNRIREFRGRANSITVNAGAYGILNSVYSIGGGGRRTSEDIHVYDNFRDPKYTVPEASREEEERGDHGGDTSSSSGSGEDANGDCADASGGVGNDAYVIDEAPPAKNSASSQPEVDPKPSSQQPTPSETKAQQTPKSQRLKLSWLGVGKPFKQQPRKHRLNTITINSALDLHITEIPPYTALTQSEAHTPSFFLRIAAVVFGCVGIVNIMVKAVDACLSLASAPNQTLRVFSILRCLINMAFNAVQTFFLFKYSKISIAFKQRACLFGLMHLLATNLCMWIGDLGEEKKHLYGKPSAGKAKSVNGSIKEGSLYQLSDTLAPYLYPFNIEYSLMAAFFCYALFRNIGAFISLLEGHGLCVEHKSLSLRNRNKTQFSVSCHKSTKGLLLGVGLVLAVICGAAYVLNLDSQAKEEAQGEKRLIQSCVMLVLQGVLLAMVVPVTAALRRLPRQLRSEQHPPSGGGASADKLMLQLGLSAVVVSELYVLLDVFDKSDSLPLTRAQQAVRVCQALVSIVQSSMQVLALDLGLGRNWSAALGAESPIGLGLVTALIPANLAVWIFYTLTGPVSSSAQSETGRVITAICLPVVIFFRFHSVGCFAELWKMLQRASDERDALPSNPQAP